MHQALKHTKEHCHPQDLAAGSPGPGPIPATDSARPGASTFTLPPGHSTCSSHT